MEKIIGEKIKSLMGKDNKIAYASMKELQHMSEEDDTIYQYMNDFIHMIENPNSYIRTRGLILIAENAKWDADNLIDEIIDSYLKHIVDVKPITSRQCIKALPLIAKYKPELKEDIITALHNADTSRYADSMRPLVDKDIREAVSEMES